MPLTLIPYLDGNTAIKLGQQGLIAASGTFPEVAPELLAVSQLLPLLGHIPRVMGAAQHLFDEINRVTGAKAPS